MSTAVGTTSPHQRVTESPSGQLTLENGLMVVWQEDHRQPLVAIEARILGGLRGEGPFLGTGMAHFIEHMLFKGTPSRPPGAIDQEVRRYGGSINAFTSHDYTGVTLFVESRFVGEALTMLADILQHATFPPEEFTKERAVVISEIHMNQDDPERHLHHLFWNTHFLIHPYRHPILGYQSLLERLTVEDLRAFSRAQYVPNNVQLACVGDLDSKAFPQLIKDTFGSWPRGAPYQILVSEEPPAVSVKRVTEERPVQAAYIMLGFPSTRLASADLYPLDVLASIVGRGRSSRLHEALVRRRRVAHLAGAANYTPLDPGVFTIFLRADPPAASSAIEAALEVLSEVGREGIAAEELKKAKRQVVADYVFGHQGIESKASDLANSLAMTGDPYFSKRYVEGIEQVTVQQVRDVAVRYLDASRMTRVVIQPTGEQAATSSASASSQPVVTNTVLPNGLTVLFGVDRQLPIAVVVAASRGGVRVETSQTQGLSNIVAQLLLKGTAHRSATDIATFVESLGGQLEAFSGRDGFGISLQVLSDDLPSGLELIHELMAQSTFPEEEVALQRQLVLKELDARDDDIFDQGSRLLRQTLFTTHPYRFDPMGTKESVQRVGRSDCVTFAKERLVPKNMVLAVFGDFDPPAVLAQLTRRFGALSGPEPTWPQHLEADPFDRARQATLTLPKEQSLILLGFRGTRLTASDRYTLDVLTTVLSGMSGRLFQAVRERQGLSYALGASNIPGWDPGYLLVYAATRPEERQHVLTTLEEQLQAVLDVGLTEDEVEQAKRTRIGNHRLDLQHLGGLAKRCTLDELYGLGHDAWTTYEDKINAVTIPMLQEAAKQYLPWSRRAEVIIGPASTNGFPAADNGR